MKRIKNGQKFIKIDETYKNERKSIKIDETYKINKNL